MKFENTREFALQADKDDPLGNYRDQFHFPQHDGRDVIYLCGNSLGLQPKATQQAVNVELEDWANIGVEGHFTARNPWYSYHELFTDSLANLVGALPGEVVCMNALTVNLHLLMASFYRPTDTRFKILYEADAFPSDKYALDSQAQFHGLDPNETVIELKPREGEYLIRHEDITRKIEELGDSLALVLLGGVNYYTGQAFDMPGITAAAHRVGALAGFDLAHAAGNLQMNLHDWEVDFAAWCSYKYLNSGPGSVAGAFVHERHCKNADVQRFAGWWGHDKDQRFKMEKTFQPMATAEAWQLSNAPVLSMAAHRAALDIFDSAGMESLCQKRDTLTGYLEFIVHQQDAGLEIITPQDKAQRGAQLSVIAHGKGKELHTKLAEAGVVADWREPNVIRMAPVPLYNSYEDVYRFGQLLGKALHA